MLYKNLCLLYPYKIQISKHPQCYIFFLAQAETKETRAKDLRSKLYKNHMQYIYKIFTNLPRNKTCFDIVYITDAIPKYRKI